MFSIFELCQEIAITQVYNLLSSVIFVKANLTKKKTSLLKKYHFCYTLIVYGVVSLRKPSLLLKYTYTKQEDLFFFPKISPRRLRQ